MEKVVTQAAVTLLLAVLVCLPVQARPHLEPQGELLRSRNPLRASKADTLSGPVWVLLADKGLTSGKDLDQALKAYRAGQSTGLRKRQDRAGFRPGFADLAIPTAYRSAIMKLGVRERSVSRWFNAISVEGSPEQLRRVAALPFVADLVPVAVYRRPLPSTGETISLKPANPSPRKTASLQYGLAEDQLTQINVPALHALGLSGAGVKVGVIDTGFEHDLHEALIPIQVIAERDFINDDDVTRNETGDPASQHNHGTQVLSVLGASRDTHYYGPAYGADYVLAKTERIDLEIVTEEDYWIEAIEWMDTLGVEVVNTSLGYNDWYTYEDMDGLTAPITLAADLAVDRGIVIAVSAGNEALSPWVHIIAPADGFQVLSVGAVDNAGDLAVFSSLGPTADGRIKPEVCALGSGNTLAMPGTTMTYTFGSGTSYASPLVAGVAALLLEAHPDWSPAQVREALLETADQAGAPDNLRGWGLIDATAAHAYTFPANFILIR